MFNPLLPTLTELKPLELESKISELNKKYWIAARSGNGALCQQVLVLIQQYQDELMARNMAINKIPTRNGETGLDDLINVS